MSGADISGSPSAPLTPVARHERIVAIDVLRGVAVFGIFLVNMPLFLAPSAAFFDWYDNALWTAPADRLVTLFLHIFAQGKFYTLFSFLFGLGFGMQLRRAEERSAPDFLGFYRRRLYVLLALGLLHFTLIWWGDVLHVYAALGFALLLYRFHSDRALLLWAAGLTLVPFVLALAGTTVQTFASTRSAAERQKRHDERERKRAAEIAEDIRIHYTGSVPAILVHRLKRDVRQLGVEAGWSLELFAAFLIGLWADRCGILRHPRRHRALLVRLAAIGLPIGLALTCADLLTAYWHPGREWPLWHVHLNLAREFLARPAMAAGYAAVILLAGNALLLRPFAAVGRMALTNYLLHSLVFTTVANSYGGGLYGSVPPLRALYWTLGFYALQVPASLLWLRFFPHGPFERLWRVLTYRSSASW